MERPRLLFPAEDVPLLAEAAAADDLAPLWEQWLSACEQEAQEPLPAAGDFQGWAPELQFALRVGRALEAQSYAYLMAQAPAHRDRAHQLARALVEMPVWVAECHSDGGQRRMDLTAGVAAEALALYVDWLGPELGGTRLELVRRAVQEKGVEAYLHDRELPGWFQQRMLNNWIAVMCGGLGLALLSVEPNHPRADEVLHACIFHTERYLRYIHHDGSLDESGGYWMFGFGHALRFGRALKRLGHADWFQNYPQIRETAEFPLQLSYQGDYALEFGDCKRGPLLDYLPLIVGVADEYRAPGLQCVARRLLQAVGVAETSATPQRLWDHWQTLAWYDPELAPDPSGPGTRIGSRVYEGVQWGLLRADSLFAALRGGDNARSHCHWDTNNVVFFAYGEELLSDHGRGQYSPDYWRVPYGDVYKDTRGHNCLLINGVGQKAGLNCTARVYGPTSVRQDDAVRGHGGPGAGGQGMGQYLFSEADCLYGEDQFAQNITWDRHLALFDGEWLLILDEVRTDRPVRLSWLFHTKGQIELDEEETVFRCGEVALYLEFMSEQECVVTEGDDQPLAYVRVDLEEPTDRATLVTLALPASPDHEAPEPDVEMLDDGSLSVTTKHGRYILDVPGRALWLGSRGGARRRSEEE